MGLQSIKSARYECEILSIFLSNRGLLWSIFSLFKADDNCVFEKFGFFFSHRKRKMMRMGGGGWGMMWGRGDLV